LRNNFHFLIFSLVFVQKINLHFLRLSLPTENVKLKGRVQMVKEQFSQQFNIRSIRWNELENLPEISADRIFLLRIFEGRLFFSFKKIYENQIKTNIIS